MLRRASRPERIFLSPAFSILLSVCALIFMAFQGGGAEKWIVMPLSVALGVVSTVQVRARALYKGPNFPVLSTFLLLQAAAAQTLSGCLLATYALLTAVVLFFCFLRPQSTRVFFLLFLVTGTAGVFSPQWLLWGAVTLMLMITVRAFSMRGLVASLLGIITPFIIIPVGAVAFSLSLEPLEQLLAPYLQPLFGIPGRLPVAYFFSAALCVVIGLAAFLTAYGYPAKARSRNMSVYVMSIAAIVFPLLTVGGAPLWLPLLNLCTAYHAAHFIATRRTGWVFALVIWVVILAFIIRELCIF